MNNTKEFNYLVQCIHAATGAARLDVVASTRPDAQLVSETFVEAFDAIDRWHAVMRLTVKQIESSPHLAPLSVRGAIDEEVNCVAKLVLSFTRLHHFYLLLASQPLEKKAPAIKLMADEMQHMLGRLSDAI